MKYRIYVMLYLSLSVLTIQAKSLKQLWHEMPDSLAPALDKNLRLELTDLKEMNVPAEVTTLLGDTCVLDTITTNFAQIRLNRLCTIQLKMLPVVDGDSILCMVKTIAAPARESEVTLYDQQWHTLDTAHSFAGNDLSATMSTLVQKPDTMSNERFEDLVKMIEPRMMSAMLFEHEDAIVFRLSLPLLSAEDKMQINATKMQTKLKWNGKVFKES